MIVGHCVIALMTVWTQPGRQELASSPPGAFAKNPGAAPMAGTVDALASKASSVWSVGANPTRGTVSPKY